MKIAPAVENGIRIAATALVLYAVFAFWLNSCHDPAVRAEAKLLAKDDSLNAVIAASRLETAAREKGFQSARDSTGRVIAKLLSRIRDSRAANVPALGTIVPDSGNGKTAYPVVHNPPDAAVVPIAIGDPLLTDSAQTLLTDSLVHAYEAGRRQDSLEILFWRISVVQRDSLIGSLQKSRDAWRGRAQRPSYTVTDIGGGAIAGYGIAEKNETAVLVGAGVIVVPRLLGAVWALF